MATPIRPNILEMVPYSPGKPIEEARRELGISTVYKLASNENPLGPSSKAVDAMEHALHEANLYPDGGAHDLKQALSRKFGIPVENIVLGAGSEELIQTIGLIYLNGPEDEVVAGFPSFVRYEAAARLCNAKFVNVPLDKTLTHDLPAMAKAVTDKTKIVFIANPNNPTGTIVHNKALRSFIDDMPSQVTVVVDEAYYEFASHLPEYPSAIDYLKEGKNVICLRTFSKAYGLAGMRVGYGFVSPQVEDAINRARITFNINILAQAGATAALHDVDHMLRTVQNNERGIEMLTKGMEAEGATVTKSYTNFVFADIHRPCRPVFEALLKRGVIVRPGDIFGTPTYLRVSVGTDEGNRAFLEAFKSVMREPVTA